VRVPPSPPLPCNTKRNKRESARATREQERRENGGTFQLGPPPSGAQEGGHTLPFHRGLGGRHCHRFQVPGARGPDARARRGGGSQRKKRQKKGRCRPLFLVERKKKKRFEAHSFRSSARLVRFLSLSHVCPPMAMQPSFFSAALPPGATFEGLAIQSGGCIDRGGRGLAPRAGRVRAAAGPRTPSRRLACLPPLSPPSRHPSDPHTPPLSPDDIDLQDQAYRPSWGTACSAAPSTSGARCEVPDRREVFGERARRARGPSRSLSSFTPSARRPGTLPRPRSPPRAVDLVRYLPESVPRMCRAGAKGPAGGGTVPHRVSHASPRAFCRPSPPEAARASPGD